MKKVKLAVVGVGNCASSLIQGIEYYEHHHNEHSDGIMQPQINGWSIIFHSLLAFSLFIQLKTLFYLSSYKSVTSYPIKSYY